MGSFHTTCNISQLPILPGDKVRVLFLLKNVYAIDPPNKMCLGGGNNGREVVRPTDFWIPWNIPLKAVYADYGRVAEVEEGPNLELFHECLNEMLCGVKEGPNPYHNPSTSAGMSWEQMWWAAQEGRLRLNFVHAHNEYPSGIPLCAVMIREDIWQAVLKLPLKPNWFQKTAPSPASISDDLYKMLLPSTKLDHFPFSVNEYGLQQAMRMYGLEGTPLQRALGTFLYKAKERYTLDSKEMSTVLQSIGEMCYIGTIYERIRRTWFPGSGQGTQGVEFETVSNFNSLISEVAYQRAAEYAAEDPDAKKVVRLNAKKILGDLKKKQ